MEPKKVPLVVSVRLLKTNKGAIAIKNEGQIQSLISPTQALVFSLCDGTSTVEEIINLISKVYRVNVEKVKKDIANFLESYKNEIIYLPKKLKRPLSIRDPNDFAFKPDTTTDVVRPFELDSVIISLNERCACSCKYCFAISDNEDNIASDSWLDLNLAIKFLREAKNLGASILQIGGGIPEQYHSLTTLVDFAFHKLSFKTIELSVKPVFPIKRDALRDLRKAGLVNLQVSLDSFSPPVLENLTGVKNIFENMLETIYSAIDAGLNVVIRPTITKFNIRGILTLAKLSHKIGVKYFRAVQVMPVGRAKADLSPGREELSKLENELKDLATKIQNMEIGIVCYRVGKVPGCGGGRTSCALYPSGYVSFCDVIAPLMRKFNYTFGNIRETSLEKIWVSQDLDFYRSLRCRNEICENCSTKNSCLGGCRVRSYNVFMNPDMPDPLCDKVYEHYEKSGEIFTSWKVKCMRPFKKE